MSTVAPRALPVLQLARPRSAKGAASIDVVRGPSAGEREARERFDREDCVLLERFLDADLFEELAGPLEAAEFAPEGHSVGDDVALRTPLPAADLLLFAMNDPRLFSAVAELTGCDRISSFAGRVYRIEPSSGQGLEWHDDRGDPGRLLAISINLGREPFQGGVLEIRDRRTGDIVHRSANTGRGDAVVFRIGEHLEHRVSPVEGTTSRTAYAGWFSSHPRFLPLGLSDAANGDVVA
jgi:hypothetical protein